MSVTIFIKSQFQNVSHKADTNLFEARSKAVKPKKGPILIVSNH